jgi:hypothetical protein
MMFKRSAPSPAPEASGLYGVMAEFADADTLLAAASRTRDAGYTRIEAYTPIPIHGLDEAVGFRGTRLPWLIFAGGMTGASFMFGFQTWVNTVAYPMNIGGRPEFSWPAFIPVTFEGMVLLAAFCAVFGLIAACGLPRLHHPVFNAPRFDRASVDLFFLCVEAADPKFDEAATTRFLEGLGAQAVSRVDN